MRYVLILLLLTFGCASPEPDKGRTEIISVSEIRPDKGTALMKQNLLHLIQIYDLDSILYQRRIEVEPMITNKATPVIRLNTKFADDPSKILSILLHQQYTHHLLKHPLPTKAAVSEIKRTLPKSNQKGFKADEILICSLEALTLEHFLGYKEALRVRTSFINKDKVHSTAFIRFQWHRKKIVSILSKHGLLPKLLHTKSK